MLKLADLIDRHGVDVLAHLDRQADVPIITEAQCQGDLLILPTVRVPLHEGLPVPEGGVVLVRGENGGNTHTLLADGPVTYLPVSDDSLDVVLLSVPAGAVAYSAHPEHAYAGVGPGEYTIRRQREQADVIRQVSD